MLILVFWFNKIILNPSLTISLIILKTLKKFINLKSITKLTSKKKLAQQQKILIAKLKIIKLNQLNLPKTNCLILLKKKLTK